GHGKLGGPGPDSRQRAEASVRFIRKVIRPRRAVNSSESGELMLPEMAAAAISPPSQREADSSVSPRPTGVVSLREAGSQPVCGEGSKRREGDGCSVERC